MTVKKILVVEDDPSAARLVGYTLELQGYEVVNASNGVEGLRKAEEEQPDLLILDVMLPGLDGFEVCHRLRAGTETAHLPILMLSAKAQEIDKDTGLKLGADQYLVKPADPEDILAKVESLLARKTTITPARAIAFLGTKGGAGTSTVAVNVAVAIAQENKRVVMMDLAPYSGSVSAFLGLKPEHTIAELWDSWPGTLDEHRVEEILIGHATGVRALCSPTGVDEYEKLTPDGAVVLVEVLRSMGDFILVDVSARPSDVDKAVLSKCDFIVVVTGSGRDGLSTAGTTVALLEKLGVGREQIGIAVVDRDGLLSQLEVSKIDPIVESTMGVPLLGIVPHDVKASLEFESQGVPVTLAEPRRPMAASLRQVADWLMSHTEDSQDKTSD